MTPDIRQNLLVRGTIRLSGGDPAGGALVRLLHFEQMEDIGQFPQEGTVLEETRADREGRVLFEVITDGEDELAVYAVADGCTWTLEPVLLPLFHNSPESPKQVHVDLVLTGAGDLEGIVTGPDGLPVAGAEVSISPTDTEIRWRQPGIPESTITDEDGLFRLFRMPLGEAHLVVRHESFVPVSQKVLVPSSGVLVTLQASGASIEGTLLLVPGDMTLAHIPLNLTRDYRETNKRFTPVAAQQTKLADSVFLSCHPAGMS